MDTLLLAFATNDDNGQNTGYATAFDFGEPLHLDMIYWNWRGIRCVQVDETHIRIGRRKFEVLGWGTWIGNMAWDGARVTLETANQIADHLRSTGHFEPTTGYSELWDMWKAGKPMKFGGA